VEAISGQRTLTGEVADMAKAPKHAGKGNVKSRKRSRGSVVKDLSPRNESKVKGGGINRIVVTDGSISAKS
jgi:hypothetical protein